MAGKARLAAARDDEVGRHVAFGDAELRHCLDRFGRLAMAFARFVGDQHPARLQGAIGAADRQCFVIGMMERVEKERGVELAVQVQRFEVAA